MWLPPRLAWRRHQLRRQAVPADGRPLSGLERYALEVVARFALIDEDGTRRVAADAEGAEMTAASRNRGGQ